MAQPSLQPKTAFLRLGQFDIKIEVDKTLQFDREQFAVPAGVERKLVVRDYVRAPFRLGEMRQTHGGDSLDPEKFRRSDATMAGDDLAVVGDQYRIVETETLNRGCRSAERRPA